MSFSTDRQWKFENTEVTGSFAIDFCGRQNFTLGEDLPSKKQPLVHAFSSKLNHLSRAFLLLLFACFYMSKLKPVPIHFFIFHMFFFLKGGIGPQKIMAY